MGAMQQSLLGVSAAAAATGMIDVVGQFSGSVACQTASSRISGFPAKLSIGPERSPSELRCINIF